MKQLLLIISLLFSMSVLAQPGFVQRKQHQLVLNNKPYYYIGTNYWYGSVLGLEKNKARGIDRLRKELNFLKAKGITNLRVMAGAEGSGIVHGIERVGPPLQTEKGKFNPQVLNGLDILLEEMGKRNMKAIIFFSNNWEWSGGFLQYLRWNNQIDEETFRKKMTWDELRDNVSKFYQCEPCKGDYLKQVKYVLSRTNLRTKVKYINDPVIMAWELANEPRPMRPASNEAYKKWISDVSAYIKSVDKMHLLTTGHEGEIGTESMSLFEEVHADKNIDYLTIHIWPRNWGWMKGETMEADFPNAISKTVDYIIKHTEVARALNKPLVVEEFGLPRDQNSFDINSTTRLRDKYYDTVFSIWKQHAKTNGVIAGANFWAFNGTARPIKGQVFWKKGDDYMGDPPMEEQGLYGVFDSDRTTWGIISRYTRTNLTSYNSWQLNGNQLKKRTSFFGLSYTQFSYSNLTGNKIAYNPNEKAKIPVNFQYRNSRDGKKVSKHITSKFIASPTPETNRLKSFEKVGLKYNDQNDMTLALPLGQPASTTTELKR